MSRKSHKVPSRLISEILLETEDRFGQTLKHRGNLIKLAEDILCITRDSLSPKTLFRIAGIENSAFNPSRQTLDILARYNNYRDWNHFEEVYAYRTDPKEDPNEMEILKDLFTSINDSSYLNEDVDPTINQIAKLLVRKVARSDKLFKKLVPIYARDKKAQYYLFEHYPYYDELANGYDRAIEAYLRYKGTSEAKLYGHSVLFLKAFLCDEKNLMEHHHTVLNKIKPLLSYHPFPLGRYFASNLLFFHNAGQESKFKKSLADMWNCERSIRIGTKHFRDFPAFQFIVSDALIHCGMYYEASKLITESLEKYPVKQEFIEKGYYDIMKMLLAISYMNCKTNIRDAIDIYLTINPSKFYFIKRKYFTMHYLHLELQVRKIQCKSVQDTLNKLEELISYTGFVKFNRYLVP